MATKEGAKERVEWAKTERRPWRTATGRDTGIHDWREYHHESSSQSSFFLVFFFRRQQYVPVIYITGLFSAGEWYTLRGGLPSQLPGTRYHSFATTSVRQPGGELAIVGICMVSFVSVAPCSPRVRESSLRRHPIQNRRVVPLCFHDDRGVSHGAASTPASDRSSQ